METWPAFSVSCGADTPVRVPDALARLPSRLQSSKRRNGRMRSSHFHVFTERLPETTTPIYARAHSVWEQALRSLGRVKWVCDPLRDGEYDLPTPPRLRFHGSLWRSPSATVHTPGAHQTHAPVAHLLGLAGRHEASSAFVQQGPDRTKLRRQFEKAARAAVASVLILLLRRRMVVSRLPRQPNRFRNRSHHRSIRAFPRAVRGRGR